MMEVRTKQGECVTVSTGDPKIRGHEGNHREHCITRNAESLTSNMDRLFQIARRTVCLATCIKANITPCELTADDQAIAAHVMRANE